MYLNAIESLEHSTQRLCLTASAVSASYLPIQSKMRKFTGTTK